MTPEEGVQLTTAFEVIFGLDSEVELGSRTRHYCLRSLSTASHVTSV